LISYAYEKKKIDQFVAVGSQCGIATFTISPHFDVVENFGLVCIVSVWT